MTHAPYTLYRKYLNLTLVCLSVLFVQFAYSATYTEQELKKLATLAPDSPNLRQSLETLKEKSKGKDIESRLLYGKVLLSAKEYNESLIVLKTINTDVEPRALVLMGLAYSFKKEYSEEVRMLEILKKTQPESEYVLTKLAEAYFKIKNPAKSVEVLKELIKKQPKKKKGYFQLFDVYENTKNSYEIRVLLADMKELFPNDPEVYTRHCKYYAVGGFLEQAIESCTKATTLDSDNAENHVYLGLTKKNLKDEAQAEKIIKKAAQQFAKSELAQYTAGQLSDESKNWEVGSRYYKKCVTFHPDSNRCHRGLAKASFEMKQYEVALKSFTLACDKDPQARNEFRNAITLLRTKNRHDLADMYNKKFEGCGLSD